MAPERPKLKKMKEEEVISESDRLKNNNNSRGGGAWQTWHQAAEKCPKGTVPIRRSTEHDVLRANSLYDFGKKRRRALPLARRANAPDVVTGNGHEVYLSIYIYIHPLLSFTRPTFHLDLFLSNII